VAFEELHIFCAYFLRGSKAKEGFRRETKTRAEVDFGDQKVPERQWQNDKEIVKCKLGKAGQKHDEACSLMQSHANPQVNYWKTTATLWCT